MSFNYVLTKLEEIGKTSSRLEKEKIFNKMLHESKITSQVVDLVFNPGYNFYVRLSEKDYPKVKGSFQSDLADEYIRRLATTLKAGHEGRLRGDDLKSMLDALMLHANREYRYWMMRIVNRDLKIGLSEKTIKKFMPGVIPEVRPALCKAADINDPKFDADKYEGWYVEPKYDGLRCIAVIKDRVVSFFSRTGKGMSNVDHIAKELIDHGFNNCVLDGELDAGNWNDSVGIAHTKEKHENNTQLHYKLWDILSLEDWNSRKSMMRLKDRKNWLNKTFSHIDHKYVELAPWDTIKRDFSVKVALTYNVQHGFEGIVVKDPNAVYEWKRGKAWVKFKPYYEDDFKVVGVKEGHGKNLGRIGSIFIAGKTTYKGKQWKVYSKCGSGITDNDGARKQMEDLHKKGKLIGTTVQVEYQAVSTKEKPEGYALQFPIFMRLRLDK